ncbi:hypothetical protein BT93_L1619 [Corymbia citriodora subsp. variegata]|uniref:Uncharacterized protein n=1 Tax=Corymbia citriodora subsp. variegata TaxID=360336 RepID=A0A8T0CXL9_CORYI|nr:hypothetical protein BT93_L1619 [Corymbia citriodora subsp. variegata]
MRDTKLTKVIVISVLCWFLSRPFNICRHDDCCITFRSNGCENPRRDVIFMIIDSTPQSYGVAFDYSRWSSPFGSLAFAQSTFQLVQHPHIFGAFLEFFSLLVLFLSLRVSHQQFELFRKSLLSLSLLHICFWMVEFSSLMRHLLQSL